MKKTTWEVRHWHGIGTPGYDRWIIPNEPEHLPNGAIKFTDSDGLERYIIGSIEVVKRGVST